MWELILVRSLPRDACTYKNFNFFGLLRKVCIARPCVPRNDQYTTGASVNSNDTGYKRQMLATASGHHNISVGARSIGTALNKTSKTMYARINVLRFSTITSRRYRRQKGMRKVLRSLPTTFIWWANCVRGRNARMLGGGGHDARYVRGLQTSLHILLVLTIMRFIILVGSAADRMSQSCFVTASRPWNINVVHCLGGRSLQQEQQSSYQAISNS